MTPFKLKIITPEKVFFDGDTEQVNLRTTEGDIGILARHEDLVANLPSGAMRIKINGEFKLAAISEGVLKVSKDKTTIIADAVEWADEIDIDWAKRSEKEARDRMEQHKGDVEFKYAELKLKRALNRLSVSSFDKD